MGRVTIAFMIADPLNSGYLLSSSFHSQTIQRIVTALLKDGLTLRLVQELLRREASRSRGGIPLLYVFLIGLVGIILGYLMKKTWPIELILYSSVANEILKARRKQMCDWWVLFVVLSSCVTLGEYIGDVWTVRGNFCSLC